MKRFVPRGFNSRTILRAMLVTFVFACATATGALAQHSGAHSGTHAAGATHGSASPAAHPASVPVAPIRLPAPGPVTNSFLVRPPLTRNLPPTSFRIGYPYPPRPPFIPRRPFVPILPFPPPSFGVFGIPFFGLGFGWGVYGGPWLGCEPLLYWGYACNGLPAYEYGPGNYSSPVQPYSPQPQPQAQIQNYPLFYGEPNSQYPQLILNDGTIYNVTDYWLEDGQLHYKTVEEHGTKVAEHTMDFDQLDLQKTIDVNTDRGFRFVLRNEPLEQYLIDHPPSDAPDETQPGELPQATSPVEP
jgi:hypothetical protein